MERKLQVSLSDPRKKVYRSRKSSVSCLKIPQDSWSILHFVPGTSSYRHFEYREDSEAEFVAVDSFLTGEWCVSLKYIVKK